MLVKRVSNMTVSMENSSRAEESVNSSSFLQEPEKRTINTNMEPLKTLRILGYMRHKDMYRNGNGVTVSYIVTINQFCDKFFISGILRGYWNLLLKILSLHPVLRKSAIQGNEKRTTS